MVQLWFPKDELKADLEDQAKKRLEEITRAADQRRQEAMEAAQQKLNDQRTQEAMERFNNLVDPLISKGREALDGASSAISDTSQRAQQLVDEANRSLQQAPTLDQLGASTRQPAPSNPPSPLGAAPAETDLATGQTPPLGAPPPPEPPAPTPPPQPATPGPSPLPNEPFGGPTGPSPLDNEPTGRSGDGLSPMSSAFSLPGLPGFQPPGLPGLPKPPQPSQPVGLPDTSGLGTALADRMRQGMGGIGEAFSNVGQAAASGRDQAMELANKSLDVAQQAMAQNPVSQRYQQGAALREQALGDGTAGAFKWDQTPTPAEVAAAPPSTAPPGGVKGPLGGLTDAFAGFRQQQEEEARRHEGEYEAWEAQQGKEHERGDWGDLIRNAGMGWEKARRTGQQQTETAMGYGTQGEGLLQQAQAGFGAAMGPYGVVPEIARGAAETSGSPLLGSAAYLAASIYGPGGPKAFLQEGLPLATRMLRNPEVVPQMLRAGEASPVFKAMAAGLGVVGGGIGGTVSAIRGLQEGATPQEAAAQGVTNAADILQISEAAGLPIDAGIRVWHALPHLAADLHGVTSSVRTGVEGLRRFGENLAGEQGQGPEAGVMFGNAPRTATVDGRQVGAIEQTLGGERELIPETQIDRSGRRVVGSQRVNPATSQIAGTLEDRFARLMHDHDPTVEEEAALGVGTPTPRGEGTDRQTVEGVNRLLGFRHPGWMAKDYVPDLEAGVMKYQVPDKERMAVEHPTWKPHVRTGPGKYVEIKSKKGGSALDALEGEDENAPPQKGVPKGTKVLLDTATGEEINIAKHPDMPWKEASTPITAREGMARDGTVEPEAKTPLSYHRMALVRGLGLRNFYPNFGEIFRDNLARKSPTLLRELDAIYGATASQASPETNLQRTLAVMAAGRHMMTEYGRLPTLNELAILTGSNWDAKRMSPTAEVKATDLGRFPAGGITSSDLAKVMKIWQTGRADIGAGWKTPVFYQNILTSARNLFDWLSVPDTHMFRGRGYTMTGGSAPATVNQDLRALGITHATVAQLADEFGLHPKQVQSALWFDYKENLAPFNATDKARIKNKAGGALEGSPEWMEQARQHDPWPTTELVNEPLHDPEGNPILKEDGTPEYRKVRQGTIDSVMQHVSRVNPGEWAKLAEDAQYEARGEVAPRRSRGSKKTSYTRQDLLQAFRDADAAFTKKYGRDALTEAADNAALTFNGRAVGDQGQTGWESAKPNVQQLTLPRDPEAGMAARTQSMEITPEAMERGAFKGGQEAPVAVIPVDANDGEALSRLGYDPETGQIDALRSESIPHEVILDNRPFTVGPPGEATPRDTIHVLLPGSGLDTARYAAALLGERAGADEAAITWPTAEGRGKPVVSVDHPQGLQWTTEEIQKYPWAQKLIGRANVSPDGRTLYFADFGGDKTGVPFADRVQGILDDAMTPEQQQALVHRDTNFGAERVGGEEFRDLVARGTLAGGGPEGEAAMARAFPGLEGGTTRNRPFAQWGEGGEAVPGSRPGAVGSVGLREYQGPESFRAPGAGRGMLGLVDGLGLGRRGDLLDEGLQTGQTIAGGLVGAKWADPGEEEDPLRRRLKQAGGFMLGAEMGARAANPLRVRRAWQAAMNPPRAGFRAYHGTPAAYEGEVRPGGGMFGSGRALSTEPKVADEFAMGRNTSPYVRATYTRDRLRDALKALPEGVEPNTREWLEQDLADAEEEVAGLERTGNTSWRGARPNVRPTEVPDDMRFWDANQPLGPNEASRIVGHVRERIADQMRELPENERLAVENRLARIQNRYTRRGGRRFDFYDELHQHLREYGLDGGGDGGGGRSSYTSSADLINEALKADGYEGISYMGGESWPVPSDRGGLLDYTEYNVFPEAMPRLTNALSGTPMGITPGGERGPSTAGAGATTPLGRALGVLRRFGENLGGDGRLGVAAKGPGEPPAEWGVPERGEQGREMGLGPLLTREDLQRVRDNPPEGGFTGEQQNELMRAATRIAQEEAASWVKAPENAAEGARAEQLDAERRRRAVRRAEEVGTPKETGTPEEPRVAQRRDAMRKVDEAPNAEAAADTVAETTDAARRGEIPHTDADAVRGRAARKLQEERGLDGPPPPGEMDKQMAASRKRRGVTEPEDASSKREAAQVDDAKAKLREIAKISASARKTQVGERAPGMSPEALARSAETPEGTAKAIGEEQPRQLAMGGELAPPPKPPKPLPGQNPPSDADLVGERARAASPEEIARRTAGTPEGTARATPAEETPLQLAMGGELAPPQEPPARLPGQEPPTAKELVGERARGITPEELARRTAETPEDVAVVRGEETPRQLQMGGELAPPAAPLKRIEGMEPPPVEQARQRLPEETAPSLPGLAGPFARRLVDERGNLLSKAEVAAQIAGDLSQPGGWGAFTRELHDGLSDAGRAFLAGARGVKMAPQEIERALSQMGRGRGKKTPDWERLADPRKQVFKDFRLSHLFDAMGTYTRLNLVLTPEGFGRNFLSTTIGLPYRFAEAAVGPQFERLWSAVPGVEDTSKEANYSREVVAMGEGMWRAGAAAAANFVTIMRRGDPTLTANQLDNPNVDFHQTRIGDAAGKLFRPMTATDAYLKTLNEGMEAYRLAYRQAQQEFDAGKLGPEGRDIRSRMLEILNTPSPKMLDQIQQAGEYNTFNEKAGRLATQIEAIKNWDGGGNKAIGGAWRLGMNFLIPFVRISTNVMKYGLERTVPGGMISMAYGLAKGDNAAQMGQRTAKMAEGALIAAGLTALQQSGMAEISGALPDDQDQRDEWKMQGKTPYSIKMGDRWYNLQNYPGLAENVVLAGMMNDFRDKKAEMDASGEDYSLPDLLGRSGVDAAMQGFSQVGVRPLFGSVANLAGMLTARSQQDRDYYRDQLAQSATGQILPLSGAMRQIGNVTDPTQREAHRFPERVAATYPWWRENLPARTNALGEEMPSEGYEFPLAGLTQSRAAREDELPRKYLGSESAAQDVEIGRAITAVQNWRRAPAEYPMPSERQQILYGQFHGLESQARKQLDKRVDQANRLAAMDRLAESQDGQDELFQFRAPTGVVSAPERTANFWNYMRAYGGSS